MADQQKEAPRVIGKARILQVKQHDISLRLIEAVRERPILFNSKRIDYRDVDLKRESWKEVQRQTKMESVEACQKLWKTLRDRFIRELRQIENRRDSGDRSAPTPSTPWPYFENLLFYKDCGRAPRTYTRSSRKQRNSVVSTSSGDDSRDNSANGTRPATVSPGLSSNCTSSSSNLVSASRDSSSNLAAASSLEMPTVSGFNHESAISPFQDPRAKTELGSRCTAHPDIVSAGISPEHTAFLERVIDTAARCGSDEDSAAQANPGRTPLREYPSNLPFRINREPGHNDSAWQGRKASVSDNVQLNDVENRFVKGITRGQRTPEFKEEALDLSHDFAASKASQKFLHVPRAILAGPSTSSFRPVSFMSSTVVDSSSGTLSVSAVHGLSNEEPPLTPSDYSDCKESPLNSNIIRKRKAEFDGRQAKRFDMDDEDTLFALALVPSLKRLDARAKSALKAKIMQSFADAECERPNRSE